MEEQLLALLRSSAAVTALVPTAAMNWRRHPQGMPYPGLVLHLINGSPLYTFNATTDLVAERVQVNCLAGSYDDAKALARAVKETLSGYEAGAFYQIRLAGERDGGDTDEAPGAPVVVMLDFTFLHRS
jgi:hypothetical protein